MHSENILRQIEALERLPNGEWRNRTISHLKNAYACCLKLESDRRTSPDFNNLASSANVNNFTAKVSDERVQCICPAGARNRSCPAAVHKT